MRMGIMYGPPITNLSMSHFVSFSTLNPGNEWIETIRTSSDLLGMSMIQLWFVRKQGKLISAFVWKRYIEFMLRFTITFHCLQKVSRRKDGQRFKLRIEVDYEQCAANMEDLMPVFTTSICVLSKRKHNREKQRNLIEPPQKICRKGTYETACSDVYKV